jgi:hypothetical protein
LKLVSARKRKGNRNKAAPDSLPLPGVFAGFSGSRRIWREGCKAAAQLISGLPLAIKLLQPLLEKDFGRHCLSVWKHDEVGLT